jgi:hypothetical protein
MNTPLLFIENNMLENRSSFINSPVLLNSMEELYDFIEKDNFHPTIFNFSMEQFNQTKTIEKDSISIEKLHSNQNVFSVENDSNDIIDLIDNSSSTTLDDSESSSHDDDDDDDDDDNEEPLDLKEWMIQDDLSSKTRLPKLYEFLHLLLNNTRYVSYASWLNKNDGLFKVHRPIQVAYLWRKVKARKTVGLMDYDNFARGIRYYYKIGTMIQTYRKHTYRFAQV